MSPRTVFENELSELRNRLKSMCFQVEAEYDKLFRALADKDEDEITALLEENGVIKELEDDVESKCLNLITKQHPLARDLRTVSASLKVVTDVKRIGVMVGDMADLLLRLQLQDLSPFSASIPAMVEQTKQQVHDAVQAFLQRDMEAAEAAISLDDVIDGYFNDVKKDIVIKLRAEHPQVDDCIDILMLAKYLERIADHAVNIGEWEIFQETGNMRDVRLL